MTLETTGPQSDPFARWRSAVAALTAAEQRDPLSPDVDDLAAEVIAARLALTQTRTADGWQPSGAAQDHAELDATILRQGTGAIERVLPEQQQRRHV